MGTARREAGIKPPDLPEAFATGSDAQADVQPHDGELREVSIKGVDLAASPPFQRIERCLLSGCTLRGVVWTGTTGISITDTRFVACDLANVRLRGAILKRVEFVDCRMTGIDLSDATLADVAVLRCRVDLSTFFSTAAERLRFEECGLRQAEFDSVTFEDVAFRRCKLDAARFVRPRFRGLDLRGSLLADVQMPPESLRNAVIDPTQAFFVASLLGVRILKG